MQNTIEYHVVTKEQPDYLRQAAECLAHTFSGVIVSDQFIQEPIAGHLNIGYQELCEFTEGYLFSVVDQGYCIVAVENDIVVGVLAGDTDAPETDSYMPFGSPLNIIRYVLNKVDRCFLDDYEKRYGKTVHDGEALHLTMLGVLAEHDRQDIVNQLFDIALEKAVSQGLKFAFAEATNPRVMRLIEKYHGMRKYKDVEGNYIYHNYEEDRLLNGIPNSISDGTYIYVRNFDEHMAV